MSLLSTHTHRSSPSQTKSLLRTSDYVCLKMPITTYSQTLQRSTSSTICLQLKERPYITHFSSKYERKTTNRLSLFLSWYDYCHSMSQQLESADILRYMRKSLWLLWLLWLFAAWQTPGFHPQHSPHKAPQNNSLFPHFLMGFVSKIACHFPSP